MDFRTYCKELKEKTAEKHKKIITDLCLLLKNCADCNNCNLSCMINQLYLCKITDNSFRLPDQWDRKTNRQFIEIAYQNGYMVSFIETDKQDYYTQFTIA